MKALLAAEVSPLRRPSARMLERRELVVKGGKVSLVELASGEVWAGALVGVMLESSIEFLPCIDPGREGAGVETVEIAWTASDAG